jgi:NDP-sugar pyrophosphorylase family protein
MNAPISTRPKIAETVVASDVKLREVEVGRCCEIHGPTYIEYTTLGDYSYIGGSCVVADAIIGKFCAIAANVRIGPPNHPMDRPSCTASPIARNIMSPASNAITASSSSGARTR